MDPKKLIKKYYDKNSKTYKILIKHSEAVAKKAVEIAKRVGADVQFVKEAAMLHDIGIFLTSAPSIGCHGKEPYIKHGILGRKILEKEGYPKHALVCERHIGVGLTKENVEKYRLPLPKKDMIPVTLEEEIVTYADKFFSKDREKEKTIKEIEEGLRRFGEEKVKKFREWKDMFEEKRTETKTL